jgi:hypothetical protein
MCQARDDTSSRFKREWIDLCIAKGKGLSLVSNIEQFWDEEDISEEEKEMMRGARLSMDLLGYGHKVGGVITGVDLAVQKGDHNDKTVLFTIWIDGVTGIRRVLSIRTGRWTGPEIIEQIKQCYADFGGRFIVENNAAQDYIRQFLNAETNIPVTGFTTGRNKAHPEFGLESVATELSNGKWIIPAGKGGALDAETHEWVRELLFYDPRNHTGDRLAASWFAREGARQFIDTNMRASAEVSIRVF